MFISLNQTERDAQNVSFFHQFLQQQINQPTQPKYLLTWRLLLLYQHFGQHIFNLWNNPTPYPPSLPPTTPFLKWKQLNNNNKKTIERQKKQIFNWVVKYENTKGFGTFFWDFERFVSNTTQIILLTQVVFLLK